MATKAAMMAMVAAISASACTGGTGSTGGDATDPTDAGPETSSRSGPPSGAPTELRWRTSGQDLVCDGTAHKVGTVEDAAPGETITFTSPMPVDVADGVADDDGHYELTWSCGAAEAGLRWELTAAAPESGRAVTFAFGATAASTEPAIEYTAYDDVVVCDGKGHDVGVVTGLEPRERVGVRSDRGDDRSPRSADRSGQLVVGWSCRPGDVGQRWTVTAEAIGSGAAVSFPLEGGPWVDDPPMAVEALAPEVPCDRRPRVIGRLVDLFPLEEVTFSAPGAEGVRPGRADGEGQLDLNWACERADAGSTWQLTARATESDETVTITVVGIEGEPPPPASVRVVEDPFVCDGGRRVVATLADLEPGEFIDFTSAEAGPLREGRFVGDELEVNWQCQPDQAGTVWEVTATGRQSGRSVTFTITGAGP